LRVGQHAQPVVHGTGMLAQQRHRIVQVADNQIRPAIVVQVAESHATPLVIDLEVLAPLSRDIGKLNRLTIPLRHADNPAPASPPSSAAASPPRSAPRGATAGQFLIPRPEAAARPLDHSEYSPGPAAVRSAFPPQGAA